MKITWEEFLRNIKELVDNDEAFENYWTSCIIDESEETLE